MSDSSDKLRLRATAGAALGTELEVTDELMIGRTAEGPGRLADDHELSREHARIARLPSGGFGIEDLGSTNGTLLNGFRVERTEPLRAGDRIELGGTTLVVQVSSPPPPEATTAAAAPEPVAAPEQPPARVALRVEIDLEAREARVALDEGSDEVRLVNRDGRWEIVPQD